MAFLLEEGFLLEVLSLALGAPAGCPATADADCDNCSGKELFTVADTDAPELEDEVTVFRPLPRLLFPLEAGAEVSWMVSTGADSTAPSAAHCCSGLLALDCSFTAALRFLDALRPGLEPLLLAAASTEAVLLRSTDALCARDLELDFLVGFVVELALLRAASTSSRKPAPVVLCFLRRDPPGMDCGWSAIGCTPQLAHARHRLLTTTDGDDFLLSSFVLQIFIKINRTILGLGSFNTGMKTTVVDVCLPACQFAALLNLVHVLSGITFDL